MARNRISSSECAAVVLVEAHRTRQRPGFFESALTRLFMRRARVTRTKELSRHFRLIDFEGEGLKGVSWSPGDKIQVKLDGGMITRTYTPTCWSQTSGATQILAYCHGEGPGSDWARQARPGDERQFFGPRSSLSLSDLSPSTLLFGDETSFALALALERSADQTIDRHYIFEVNDQQEAASVLEQLGLPALVLAKRYAHDGHLIGTADIATDLMQSTGTAILSGKASSIQYLKRALRDRGVDSRRVRTKAYWAPGKVGLD